MTYRSTDAKKDANLTKVCEGTAKAMSKDLGAILTIGLSE